VPDTYLLAKRRYPFLPQRTVALDVTWASFTPMARAAFLLDYVHRLYARTDARDAALRAEIGDCPTVVFRTTDHPKAAGQTTRTRRPARVRRLLRSGQRTPDRAAYGPSQLRQPRGGADGGPVRAPPLGARVMNVRVLEFVCRSPKARRGRS
jgi:hypothetical protein